MLKWAYLGSPHQLAFTLQRMTKEPEASGLEKTSSKSCFAPLLLVTSLLISGCFTNSEIRALLKEYARNTFYVKGSHKIWITEKLFLNWSLKCFVPEVKQYLNKNNLVSKVTKVWLWMLICIYPSAGPLLHLPHLGVRKRFMMYSAP